MTTTFADRWGVPVQAGNRAAVLLLDQAIEDLVALSGDPAGGAEAAVAADGELALARSTVPTSRSTRRRRRGPPRPAP